MFKFKFKLVALIFLSLSHLVANQSGDHRTQTDYVLYPVRFHKVVTNVKVIPGEECASQHRLLTCGFKYLPQREGNPHQGSVPGS